MHIPTIKYESEEQFRTSMDEHAYDIHMRTLYGIKEALRIKEDYLVIAYLETDEHQAELGAPIDIWTDNLEKSLDYFEEMHGNKKRAIYLVPDINQINLNIKMYEKKFMKRGNSILNLPKPSALRKRKTHKDQLEFFD